MTLSNSKAFQLGRRPIQEIEATAITHLKTTNDGEHAEIAPVELLVIDLIANLVVTILDEEHFHAFVHLGRHQVVFCVYSNFELVHKINHEVAVHFVLIVKERILYLHLILFVVVII